MERDSSVSLSPDAQARVHQLVQDAVMRPDYVFALSNWAGDVKRVRTVSTRGGRLRQLGLILRGVKFVVTGMAGGREVREIYKIASSDRSD